MSDRNRRRLSVTLAASSWTLLVTLGIAAASGCGRSRTDEHETATLRPQSEAAIARAALDSPQGTPPVVVISIDTLRSDRLPAYGYPDVDTPNIDRLRADSILFEHVFSPYPLTLPAHSSMLTGLLPPEHGVRDNSGYRLDASHLPFLPRLLQEHGYATGAAVSSYVLRATTGLSSGFDFYDDGVQFRSQAILGDVQRAGIETLASARSWLRTVADVPFFFFFHIYEPHTPHAPPEPFASRYSSAYDGEVAVADFVVGKLLEELESLGLYDPALIILTSDHGEGLDDHGDYEHGLLLYREAIQVPLLIKLPGGQKGGSTISEPGQLIDIFPTIVDLVGLESVALPGRSLLRPVRDSEPGERSIYSETYFPRLHFGWSELRSLIEWPYHYIEGPDPELYDLVNDPEQKDNILLQDRRIFGRLRQQLASYDAAFVAPSEDDQETKDRLEALGYLGGVGGSIEGPLPDPKSQLHVLDGLKIAVEDFTEGRYERAVEGFESVLQEQPRLIDAWEHLGQAQMALGRVDEALRAFETGFEVSGGSPHFATELAGALLKMNRLEEARQFAEIAADTHELSHDLLAQIAIRQGDLAAAEKYVERAVETRGTRIAPLITQAELRFLQNRLEEVVRLTLDIEEIAGSQTEEQLRGLFFLRGSAYVRLGQGEQAIGAFRREIDLFPDEVAAYSRLAILYKLLDRPDEAVAVIEDLIATNPTPQAYVEAVQAYRSMTMSRKADTLLSDALKRWPGYPGLQALIPGG